MHPQQQHLPVAPPLLFLHYGDSRPVATDQKESLSDVEHAVRQFFDCPPFARLRFYTKFGNDDLVQIDPAVWPRIYETVTSLWIESEETPEDTFRLEQVVVRKPVIYLYPPVPISINVCLSLISTWEFSAIYPLAPIKQLEFKSSLSYGRESVSWNVFAEPDGTLHSSDGLEVSYLYWEAEVCTCGTIATPPASRSHSPVLGFEPSGERFDPSNPILTPQNSILLQAPADLIKYLDQTLLTMGLHTEARTSFITYWLPFFVKHEYVALRFLEQSSYEYAARLDITPKPDVVTRVFMLFRGIGKNDLVDWAEAEERAKKMDIADWKTIVGVDVGEMQRQELFRVLEWGGMEVY